MMRKYSADAGGRLFPAPTDEQALRIITHFDYWSRPVHFAPEETINAVNEGQAPGDSLRGLLGRDRSLLVMLSGPAVSQAAVRHIVDVVRWTLNVGLHASYNERLCSGDPVEQAPHQEAGQPSPLFEANLLDDDTFNGQLDLLLEWKRLQSGSLLPGGKELTEISHEIASAISLPEPAARLLFSGASQQKKYYDFTFDKGEVAYAGLSVAQASAMCYFYSPDGLEPPRLLLPGLTWHPAYFTEGPTLNSLIEWWTQIYGPKWIDLQEDDLWDLLSTAGAAYGQYGELSTIRYTLRDPLFYPLNITTLLNMAGLVEPRSKEAVTIAACIEDKAIATNRESDWAPFGRTHSADFSDQRFKGTTRWVDHRIVGEGYVDAWLDHLRYGTTRAVCSRDPRVSAPEVVAAVQARHDLSEDAATYFLQLLTLTVPKDQWVRGWNKWPSQRLRQAAAELVEADLVVEDKRAGAGRKVFLPGRWLTRSFTGPGMEASKAYLYVLWNSSASRPVLEGAPPLKPYGCLFADAFAQKEVSGH